MLSDPYKATTGALTGIDQLDHEDGGCRPSDRPPAGVGRRDRGDGSGGMKELSRSGRAYVLVVIAVGGGLILSSMIQLALDTTTPYWVIVAALALFSAPLAIRVPSMRATVTVTETFVFAAALLFGPAAATLTIALDGLLVSVWAERRNLHRALFNIGEPAISVFVAAQLFYLVSGVRPLFGSAVGLGEVLVPLLLMTTSYFVINGALSVTVVWFETRVNPVEFLRDQLLHTGINYFTSCSFVVLLVLNLDNLTFAAVGVFVPLLALSYASSRLSTARVEATNGHLNELRQLSPLDHRGTGAGDRCQGPGYQRSYPPGAAALGGAGPGARHHRRPPDQCDRGGRAASRSRETGRARAHSEQAG